MHGCTIYGGTMVKVVDDNETLKIVQDEEVQEVNHEDIFDEETMARCSENALLHPFRSLAMTNNMKKRTILMEAP